MWVLNKVHDMSMQFVGDKENKGVVQNRLKYFINGNLIYCLYTLNISLVQLVNTLVTQFSYPRSACMPICVLNMILIV